MNGFADRLASRLVPLFLSIVICFDAPVANAVYGDSDEAFGLEASFRSVAGASFNYDNALLFPDGSDADAFLQAPLRIIAAGRPTSNDRYAIHIVQFMTAGTFDNGNSASGDTAFGLSAGTSRYRALDLTWNQVSDDRTQLALTIDRMSVAHSNQSISVTLGRQAISLGHAFLWSPMDVFLPFDPRQFDQEYKPGVDAARLTWWFGELSGAEAIGVFGRKTDVNGAPLDPSEVHQGLDWYGSAVLARIYTNVASFDLSIQGGKVYGGHHIAGGITGDTPEFGSFGSFDVRAEVAYLFAQSNSIPASLLPIVLPETPALIKDHLSLTVAMGYRFEPGVTVQLQYFYNGAADSDDRWTSLARTTALESFTLSRHQIGLIALWETTPLINLSLLSVISASDGSLQLQPLLRYSLSDESEFIAGAALNFGDRPSKTGPLPSLRSEYGTFPHSLFFEYKFYF